jgi:hypothetical protein
MRFIPINLGQCGSPIRQPNAGDAFLLAPVAETKSESGQALPFDSRIFRYCDNESPASCAGAFKAAGVSVTKLQFAVSTEADHA